MIYWPKQADEFTMRIPNATGYIPAAGDPALWLEVRNNVGLRVFGNGFVPGEVTPLYFVFYEENWSVPEDWATGEYTYTLRLGAGGIVLSEGLVVIGDYTPERKEYDKKIEYKQYGK